MIKEIDDLNKTASLFKRYFPTYSMDNIYEHVAVYEEKEKMSFISYSIIYERMEINYIITLPEYRHQGLAGELIKYVTKKAITLNCHNISLEVNVKNQAAINLYLKNGFKKQALRKNYYNGEDAYLMVKELVVI